MNRQMIETSFAWLVGQYPPADSIDAATDRLHAEMAGPGRSAVIALVTRPAGTDGGYDLTFHRNIGRALAAHNARPDIAHHDVIGLFGLESGMRRTVRTRITVEVDDHGADNFLTAPATAR